MNSLDADDRQQALHSYRMVAEHIGLFNQALTEQGLTGGTRKQLVLMMASMMLESIGESQSRSSFADMMNTVTDLLNKDDEDE